MRQLPTNSIPEDGSRDAALEGTAARADDVSQRLRSLRLRDDERRHINRPRRRLLRWLLLILLLGGVAYGALEYSRREGNHPAPAVDALPVPAPRRDSVVLSLSGVIVPETKVNVTPLVPGPITELPIVEGMLVRKGDVLARIEDTNYRADYQQAQASLALVRSRLQELENGALEEEIQRAKALLQQARAQFRLSERQLERAKSLKPRNSISQAEYDAAVANREAAQAEVSRATAELQLVEQGPRKELIDAARAEVARAEAQLVKAKFFLDNTTVLAPVDGTVLEKTASLGEVSRSDYFLTSLCVLGDLTCMIAEIDVQEGEIHRIRKGQPCRVIPDAFPDQSHEAAVAEIQPQVNRQRGVVKVTVRILEADGLLFSEMNCRVEFLKDQTSLSTAGEDAP